MADDDFAIVLDPFNNQRSGYFFAINPNGVREDALYENTTSMEFNWDGIFFAATTQDEDGWTAEVALPFKTLSFDPENDTWGINFLRRGQRLVMVNGGIRTGEFFEGDIFNVRAQVSWNASRHFRASAGYDYNEIDLPQGTFETRLVRLRMDLIFSSKWSWVNLVQYDNVSETAGLNSRIEWIPAPGREGYIVLNHNIGDPDRDDRFDPISSDLAVKFSYTFRF